MPYRLSVVIPTYNDAQSLPQTVASLLAQDRPADEIVIVNDAGADPQPCLGAMAAHVRILHQPRNMGASAARNTGLAATSGDLVHFLDSDDVVAPDFHRLAAAELLRHPQAAFAIGDGTRTPESEFDTVARALPSGRQSVRSLFAEAGPQFAHVAGHPGFYLLSLTLWRRDRMELTSQKEWLDTRLKTDEDFQMYLRTTLRHGAVRIDDIMGAHRLRPGSLTKNAERVWANRTRAMDLFLAEDDLLARTPGATARIRALRGNGARRLARILAAEGKTKAARDALVDDLRRNPDPASRAKSALLCLRASLGLLA